MQHKHTQVSSRFGHVPASAPFKVVIGGAIRSLSHVSAAARRGGTLSLGKGAVKTACFAIISRGHDVQQLLPCDDVSRFQDVEMTIGKGPFQIEGALNSGSAIPVGFLT